MQKRFLVCQHDLNYMMSLTWYSSTYSASGRAWQYAGAAMDVGCLSIPIELIEQALDQEAQQLLLPKPLQACFSQWNPSSTANGSIPNGVIKPADVFREELLHLRHDEMAANETKDTTARPGAIWGLKTKVGQPLQLSLQVLIYLIDISIITSQKHRWLFYWYKFLFETSEGIMPIEGLSIKCMH